MANDCPIIAIDFGTSYSRVGVFKNGKVEIIAKLEGSGSIPSVVAFTETGILTGEPAQEQMADNPGNTVFGVKRLLGRPFDDSLIKEYMNILPFETIRDDGNGQSKVRVYLKGESKSFSPENIAHQIFKTLKVAAEAFLGRPVEDVVITVPNGFTTFQRESMKKIAELAELKVICILNEGTAAAVTYFMEKIKGKKGVKKEGSNVLVVDIGGGSTNVTVARIDDWSVEVKSMSGNTAFGGEDLNTRMVSHLVQEFKQKHRKDVSSNKQSMLRLRITSETAKKTLSSFPIAEIKIDNLFEGIDFHTKVTRLQFECFNDDLFQELIPLVEKSLSDAAKMTKSKIDDIFLVGGTTRIPKIQKMVEAYFNDGVDKKLTFSDNPELAVCYGAVVRAARFHSTKFESIRDMLIWDALPHSLGIRNWNNDCMETILPRNSTIPTKQTFTISSDHQASIEIEVYEGEKAMAKDNLFLGKLTLDGIPSAPSGNPEIQVTFGIELDGNITIIAKEMTTGKEERVNLSELLQQTSCMYKQDSRRVENRDDNELSSLLCNDKLKNMKDFCNTMKGKMEMEANKAKVTDVERWSVVGKCNDTISWINSMKNDIERKQKELDEICDPVTIKLSDKRHRIDNDDDTDDSEEMEPQPGSSNGNGKRYRRDVD